MTRKAPVPGAVRITKLAPAVHDDPFEYVRVRMQARGWVVHEQDRDVSGEGYSPYVLVTAWATPPSREVVNDGT